VASLEWVAARVSVVFALVVVVVVVVAVRSVWATTGFAGLGGGGGGAEEWTAGGTAVPAAFVPAPVVRLAIRAARRVSRLCRVVVVEVVACKERLLLAAAFL
jgi:hypothetical protein